MAWTARYNVAVDRRARPLKRPRCNKPFVAKAIVMSEAAPEVQAIAGEMRTFRAKEGSR